MQTFFFISWFQFNYTEKRPTENLKIVEFWYRYSNSYPEELLFKVTEFEDDVFCTCSLADTTQMTGRTILKKKIGKNKICNNKMPRITKIHFERTRVA